VVGVAVRRRDNASARTVIGGEGVLRLIQLVRPAVPDGSSLHETQYT
jgi:hypothetical protein